MYNSEEVSPGTRRPQLPPLSAMGWLVEARYHSSQRGASSAANGEVKDAATTAGVFRWLGHLPGFLRLRAARLRNWWHPSKGMTAATHPKAL